MPTNDERPVLDYARPEDESSLTRLTKAVAIRAVVGVALFFAAITPPHPPSGIWYFGPRPQWVVAIDHAGLTIGPQSNPVLFGMAPVIIAKLVVIALPVWLIWRFGFRSHRGGRPTVL